MTKHFFHHKLLKNSSIRTKFAAASAFLLITIVSILFLAVSRFYKSSYESHILSARSDFENSVSDFIKYEEQLIHLIPLFQSNGEIIELLTEIDGMTPTECQSAMSNIRPVLYTLSDEPDEYSCRLYVNSSLELIDSSSRIMSMSTILQKNWARQTMSGWGNWRFLCADTLESNLPALVAPIRSQLNNQDLVGLLRIDLKDCALERRLYMPFSQEYTTCFLQSTGGCTICCTDPQAENYILNAPEKTLNGFESFQLNTLQDGKDTVFYRTLPYSGWRLMMIVHHDRLHNTIFPQLTTLTVLGCVLTLTGILCALPFLLSIIMRIRKFYVYVQSHSSSTLQTIPPRFKVLGDDEIDQLIKAHNALLDRIQQLLDYQHRREKEMRNLEISVLQAQINPHFLYNTLDAILWMSKLNQTEEMEKTVQNLTRFYRLCLSKGKDILPIAQELEIVQNYFAIQATRYGKPFSLFVDVPDSILHLKLPKITLQPLVENALFHGILESGRQEGWVRILGRFTNGHPELCILDSGAHLSPEAWEMALHKQPSSNPSADTEKGYGLYNVEHRLCLFFQVPQVMYLDCSDPQATCIVIPFPTQENQKGPTD